MLKRYCFLVLFLGLLSCGDDTSCNSNVDLSDIEIALEFDNLTHEIHGIKTKAALNDFLAANPIIRDEFFEFGGRPSEQKVLNDIAQLVQADDIKSLFNIKSFAQFEEILDKERELREFVAYEYLETNKGKRLKDIYDIFSASSITRITGTESTSLEPLKTYLESNPVEKDYFYTLFAFRSDEQLLQDNFDLLQNPFVDTLYQETINLIDAGLVSYELDRAYARLQKHYPEFESPKVKAVYSGFGADIYFSDTLIVLGMDYYLGENASYRPTVYDYIRIRLTPDHLVPQLLQFTSLKFNKNIEGKRNVLEEMISYGKALEFSKEMLPCVPDSLIMGYTNQQLANATVSEGVIWSHFVENKLLYSDSPSNIKKYVDERPFVPEIDKICPGRIGQWVGWQIVRAYREETGVDFVDLMNETDAQKILTQSKYRPRYR